MKKPTKKNRGTNLSLNQQLKREAERCAKANGESLTGMVERLLVAEIANPTPALSRIELMRELREARLGLDRMDYKAKKETEADGSIEAAS